MLEKHIIENINRFVKAELGSRGHPGSSLSVIQEESIVWSKGFGYANITEKKEAKEDTIYRCASVTKPVVTVGILQLMEKGKFNLDDEANSHLDVKIRDVQGDEPTIRDLLTHSSGMPTRVPPIYTFDEKPLTMKEYIGSAARAVKPRGESWAYCNTGYMIVGYLIELFTGITYDEYIIKNVLEPLEMNSSTFTYKQEINDRLAQGYKREGGPSKSLTPVAPYILGTKPEDPAGSMYSTVLDLANFVIMNMNGGSFKGKRVLKEDTISEMQKLQSTQGTARSGMGLTWFYNIHDGHVMLNHTGGLPDFTNNVCFYPEQKVGVCWLSNLQDGSGWRPPSPTVLRLVLNEKPRFGTSFQKVPNNWEKICGVYGDETRQVMLGIQNGYITLNNGLLEKIDDTHFIVHGPSNDGNELAIEYRDDGYSESIIIGTTIMNRYTRIIPEIDKDLKLQGKWVGEYYNSSGFHTLELDIKNNEKTTLCELHGDLMNLKNFKAEKGKISGSFRYLLPKEYARWGTKDHIDINLELVATEGQLKGLIKSYQSSIPITLIRN
jgi:CubicO group peptidase (beta-lactamase class C family)